MFNSVLVYMTRIEQVSAETMSAMSGKTNTIIVCSTSTVIDTIMKRFQCFMVGNRYDKGKEVIMNLLIL